MTTRFALCIASIAVGLTIAAPAQASDGTWDRAWGHDVIAGNAETGFEVCLVATSCQTGTTGGLGGQLSEPTDAAVDSVGNVYVVDIGRISKFDSSGNFLRLWGMDVVSSGPGDTGTGPEICVPANGDVCKAAGPNPLGMGGGLGSPYHVDTDASDNVYVVEVGSHRISKFSSSGTFLRTWGRNVAFAGPGDTGTGFEICVPANGDACQQGATGSLGGEMSFPQGVGVDADGNVYVSESSSQRVQKFDTNGNFLRAWGKDVVATGSPNDNGTNFEICVAGVDTCKAGASGGLGGEFNLPYGATTDAGGNVYIADAVNLRVQKFDSSGNFLRTWGKDVVSAGPGESGGGFEICVVANGDTCKAGSSGGLGGEMYSIRGVATDGSGGVYLTDGRRIQRFDSSGNFVLAWGKDVVSAGPGNTGTGFEVCVAANGDTCSLAADGTLGGELQSLDGLGAASTGEVYVADENNNRIQKYFDPLPSPPPSTGTPPAASPPTALPKKKCKKAKKRSVAGAAKKKCKKRK